MSAGDAEVLKFQTTANGLKIVVSGRIDERSNLALPEGMSLGSSIQIDTAAVERINSLGVSNWMRFMRALSAPGIPISISQLSVVLVGQARVVSNFLGSAQVESFMAPYYCPSCDNTADETFARGAQPPESISCPTCQAGMEFDDDYETYLQF